MRIGNLEDIAPSKTHEFPKETDAKALPEETEKEKKQKKWKNWWYYHKWYIICGLIILIITGSLIKNALGIGIKSPDFQIAYVGKTMLPEETVTALEKAFASIASDFNGDGEIIVQINQYIDDAQLSGTDAEAAYYEYASEISLIGDISECESYFFLMDSPDQFQKEFQLLATADGDCPDDADYSTTDKVISWSLCPLLTGMELGTYSTIILGETITGNNQELLSELYLGRRCFFTDKQTENSDKCSELWDLLYRIQQSDLLPQNERKDIRYYET